MIGAETVGIAAIAMVLGQGLVELTKFIISKFSEKDHKTAASIDEIQKIVNDAVKKAVLDEPQAVQLRSLYEIHMKFDPRSWNETMRDIIDRLYKLAELQNKTLVLVERLERKLDERD